MFLTATLSELSFRSRGARYNFSRSSNFLSESARAILWEGHQHVFVRDFGAVGSYRISTFPTNASSRASGDCAEAILRAGVENGVGSGGLGCVLLDYADEVQATGSGNGVAGGSLPPGVCLLRKSRAQTTTSLLRNAIRVRRLLPRDCLPRRVPTFT